MCHVSNKVKRPTRVHSHVSWVEEAFQSSFLSYLISTTKYQNRFLVEDNQADKILVQNQLWVAFMKDAEWKNSNSPMIHRNEWRPFRASVSVCAKNSHRLLGENKPDITTHFYKSSCWLRLSRVEAILLSFRFTWSPSPRGCVRERGCQLQSTHSNNCVNCLKHWWSSLLEWWHLTISPPSPLPPQLPHALRPCQVTEAPSARWRTSRKNSRWTSVRLT